MKKQLSSGNLIRFANVNARSLNNKTAEFVDHAAILKSFPRQSDRRGGGTGVMFSTCVNFKFINGEEKCSFEYSEWNCNVAISAIKIIAVYRPPYSQGHAITSTTFFEEFSSFLEGIVMCPEILLIAGDFNFQF